jgi:hypothetical protein
MYITTYLKFDNKNRVKNNQKNSKIHDNEIDKVQLWLINTNKTTSKRMTWNK